MVVSSQSTAVANRFPAFPQTMLGTKPKAQPLQLGSTDWRSLYETRLWYPLVLYVYGGFQSPSFGQLVNTVTQNFQAITGRVLDVACGPDTYGRRIASPWKEVLGIDVSMGMLRQRGRLTLQKKVFPTSILPVQGWRQSHSRMPSSMPQSVLAPFICFQTRLSRCGRWLAS
jgi:SAM-dependent methyltransferase